MKLCHAKDSLSTIFLPWKLIFVGKDAIIQCVFLYVRTCIHCQFQFWSISYASIGSFSSTILIDDIIVYNCSCNHLNKCIALYLYSVAERRGGQWILPAAEQTWSVYLVSDKGPHDVWQSQWQAKLHCLHELRHKVIHFYHIITV